MLNFVDLHTVLPVGWNLKTYSEIIPYYSLSFVSDQILSNYGMIIRSRYVGIKVLGSVMIVVGGEALIDLVLNEIDEAEVAITTQDYLTTEHQVTLNSLSQHSPTGKHGVVLRYHGTIGGGPLNAAVTAARLGSQVFFYGCISNDTHGKAILAALHASGVQTEFIQKSNAPTMMALATLDENKNAHYNFYLSGIADADVKYIQKWTEFPDIIAIGGLGLVLEKAWKTYAALINNAVQLGKISIIDPNIRPSAINNPVKFKQRLAQILADAVIIKLSDDDLAWITDSRDEESYETWIKTILSSQKTTIAVLITYGEHGLRLITCKYDLHMPAPKTAVVDTIGAGDSVTGSLSSWLDTHQILTLQQIQTLDEKDWLNILEWCSTIAAITVARAGANPPWVQELPKNL